jgi:hypothetical protein
MWGWKSPPFVPDEPRSFEVLHQAFGDDRRHHLAGVVGPLAPDVAQREGECIGEVFGAGGREAVGVGHRSGWLEHRNKTRTTACQIRALRAGAPILLPRCAAPLSSRSVHTEDLPMERARTRTITAL